MVLGCAHLPEVVSDVSDTPRVEEQVGQPLVLGEVGRLVPAPAVSHGIGYIGYNLRQMRAPARRRCPHRRAAGGLGATWGVRPRREVVLHSLRWGGRTFTEIEDEKKGRCQRVYQRGDIFINRLSEHNEDEAVCQGRGRSGAEGSVDRPRVDKLEFNSTECARN